MAENNHGIKKLADSEFVQKRRNGLARQGREGCCIKEYGGYLELEQFHGREYHENSIALNCGRGALAYLIQARKIREIALPYFLCGSVAETCRRLKVHIRYYHITEDFMPAEGACGDEFFYAVNYYEQVGQDAMGTLAGRCPGRLIADYAQAFFEKPASTGADTLYTCRKFFGVADGAYLYTDKCEEQDGLPLDESFARMGYVLGRYERTASEFYKEFAENNDFFSDEPVRKMSKLTRNLLKGIDYDAVRHRRTGNFRYLHERLRNVNKLAIDIPEGPFMYPLYVKGGNRIREKLRMEKIYIPVLWPDVFKICRAGDLEYDMAENILPLPVDQRYTEKDMEYICSRVERHLGKTGGMQ